MKQLFNEATLYSKLILSILSSTYLPVMNTISYGEIMMEGCTYATQFAIIKCTSSGVYGDPVDAYDPENPTIRNKRAEWKQVRSYLPGTYYPKFTERFNPTANYYDTKTHEWLGKYLRYYRDMYDIDLMPFYNCFSNAYLSNVIIDKEGVYSYVTNAVKTIRIPIRFNKKYLIAIDCSSQVKIAPAFLSSENFLTLKSLSGEEDISITNLFIETYPESIKIYPNMQFKQPITYEVKIEGTEFTKYERNLYMLIQVPFVNKSSVVVLEGDYRYAFSDDVVINAEYCDSGDIVDSCLNQVMLTPLSLLQFSSSVNYPFSNRLIEYLLGNVIDSTNTIDGNIAIVLDAIPGLSMGRYVRGVWNQYTRKKLFYQLNTDLNIRRLDLNGFLDMNSEGLINRK